MNFIDSVPKMDAESIGRLVGEAENAVSYLREAWKEAKGGEISPRRSIMEAGERLENVSRSIGFMLFTQQLGGGE